jgi:hypothetical protein
MLSERLARNEQAEGNLRRIKKSRAKAYCGTSPDWGPHKSIRQWLFGSRNFFVGLLLTATQD